MKGIFNIFSSSTDSTNKLLTTQNVRADIIGELEAIIQYELHLEQTTDQSAKNTISDIVDEEKVHVGQLFGLLFKLDPMSKELFYKGLNEFNKDDSVYSWTLKQKDNRRYKTS